MNLTRTMSDISNVYSEKVVVASKTFANAKDKKETKAFIDNKSGPENASGFEKNIVDPKNVKKNKENYFEPEKFSSQNFNEKNEKMDTKDINNFMSKSIFDKLFEDVMGSSVNPTDETDALDLGVGADHNTEETGSSEEVTVTLSKDLAQKLYDVLGSVVNAETEKEEEVSADETESEDASKSEDAEEKHDKEDKKDEDEEAKTEVAGEATELTAVPDSKGQALAGKNNKVGGTVDSLVSKGHGDGKVKGEVDGKGKDLPDSAGAKLQSKNNKVPGKASNTGHYIFQK